MSTLNSHVKIESGIGTKVLFLSFHRVYDIILGVPSVLIVEI